jgi:hypothetical protein
MAVRPVTTNAYAAKRALFERLIAAKGQLLARLQAETPPGEVDDVQVAYSYPRTPQRYLVYGGGVTFGQDTAGTDGQRDVLVQETATIGVYIRVALPGGTVEAADVRAEALGEAFGQLLANEPDLCGANSLIDIAGGEGNYGGDDSTAVSLLTYQVTVLSYL